MNDFSYKRFPVQRGFTSKDSIGIDNAASRIEDKKNLEEFYQHKERVH
ncbi:MAG: hypothetical protein KBC28_08125 [Alphaproteobacteria bacterium]|jgi:hypothetical protein|nr:hypothetical protein [Alphaproteobacteria bacterium]